MSQGNILIVDDEPLNRKLLSILLKKDAYTFFEAEDGVIGLEILDREDIDLVLLDIMMPRMDGFQFLEEYRSRRTDVHIPIIVSSALTGYADIEKALKLGAADYFKKPLSDEVKRFQLPLKTKNLIELKKLQEKALESEKMRAVMALAGTANHEINQPLQVISGNLQLLLLKMSDADPLFDKLTLIQNNVQRITDIVKKIGKINRFTTKQYVEDSDIVDLDNAFGDDSNI